MHFLLLPSLLFLPAYLGYSIHTFTSIGPSGGILYPEVMDRLPRGNRTQLGHAILLHTPWLLEPISSPIGSPASISGGVRGPISVLLLGLLMGSVVLGLRVAGLAWFVTQPLSHLKPRDWIRIVVKGELPKNEKDETHD